MTKSEAIMSIVAKAEAFSNLSPDSEARINAMAEQYYDMACAFTGFSVLPDALLLQGLQNIAAGMEPKRIH